MSSKVIVVSFAFIFFISGCATDGRQSRQGSASGLEVGRKLTISPELRFDDVPIPSGFAPVPNESFVYQTENFRAGILRYAGKPSPEAVMEFYKEQMPLYNWQSINIIEFEKKQLGFEKTGQSCIVFIEGKGSKSIITISVGPKSEKAKIVK